ncbi:hypothetical protein [Nocardiopsis baichengensis]|uniref:hypothetical protein n=1 Tax=Nocardiopsis baichengensis TaxID=280240 RepID=UPI001268FDA4|nr:hypothetical protein [Nocardiopsis baichengensis]
MPTESDDPDTLRAEFRHRLRLRVRAFLLMALASIPMLVLLVWSPGRDLDSQFKAEAPCESPVASLFSDRDWRSQPEGCAGARAQNTAWAAFLSIPTFWAARRWVRIYWEHPPPTSAEYVRIYTGASPT